MRSTDVPVSPDDSRRLRTLNLWIGLAHLLQAGLMLVLSNDLSVPIVADFLDDDPVAVLAGGGRVDPTTVSELAIGPAVAVFLLLAAVDHLLSAGPLQRTYEGQLRQGRNDLRWAEYSVSASLMLVLIAVFVGIWDLAALVGLVGINSAMIGFGALQERYARPGRDASLRPFWFGTAAGAVPWVVIGIYLLQDAAAVPTFVFVLYAVELAFFWSFGLTQWLQYRQVGRWSSYLTGERTYIWLSLGAKSALAWLVFGNVLRS
ncbi:MAG: heliorhodopsin HeR [Actinomycetes bacterium]